MPTPLISLLTDFGTADGYVGIMKGVVLGICPSAQFVDLTHDVPRQGIVPGALVLRHAVEYFPPGAIHLAVVDPGVGSARDPILVVTERGVLVGPDNGLLAPAAATLKVREIRRLEASQLFRPAISRTFHGRDVFAPVAGHLAAGVPPDHFGLLLPQLSPLPLPKARHDADALAGEVLYVDHFGNLISNITADDLAVLGGGAVMVKLSGGPSVPLVDAYAAVERGQPLAIVDSWGCVEIAIRDGNAAQTFGAACGTALRVQIGQ